MGGGKRGGGGGVMLTITKLRISDSFRKAMSFIPLDMITFE